MTTLRQIINRAYRESNLIEVGEAPELDEFNEGLWKLKNLIKAQYGYEAGEAYVDISLKDSHYQTADVPANSRLLLNTTSNATVTLPSNPRDGARFAVIKRDPDLDTISVTVDANGRTIDGSTTQSFTDDVYLQKEWFYRADLGDWVVISDLDADSTMPFPEEFDDYFIILLAMRLNPAYGSQISQEGAMFLREQKSKFRNRYAQIREADSELALLSRQWRFASVTDFNTGRVV